MNLIVGKISRISVSAALMLFFLPAIAHATTIGNTITVTNDATISGNVTTTNATSSGYMDIGGKLANSNASYGNGDLNVGNQLAVDGSTWVSSTLHVTGNSRFYGTLTVDTSVSSTIVTSSRHLGVGSPASLSARWSNGDANFGGQILVDGKAHVSSTLQVTGLLTLYNGVSTTGGIYPRSNNAIDLGGYGAAWRNIYTSGTIYAGSAIIPENGGTAELGGFGNAFGTIFSSGTVHAGFDIIAVDDLASSTILLRSNGTGYGGRIILEDTDGSGCGEIHVNNGVLATQAITCPNESVEF